MAEVQTSRAGAAGRAFAAHLRAHHEWYWVPLAYAAALGVLYRQLFFPQHGAVGFGWDTIEAYWGDLAHFADRLRHGQWPIWDAFEKGGFPDLAVPERGHYYPLNWVLGGWGAALGEVPWWMIQLKQLAHHLVAGCALHLYLRSRRLPRGAALVGGMAWMSSAPLLIHKASSILWPMVWTPLVWLAADRVTERPSWRTGCGLAAAVGLCGVAGSAPGFFYALLMALPYGALRVGAALWRVRRDRAARRRLAGQLGLAIAVGAAVSGLLLAVVYVPTGELTALSQRAERGVGYALSFPLPARATLVGMWAPLAGKLDTYLGAAVMLLALIAVATRPRRDGGVPIGFALGALGFLVLAFGGATPVLPFLARHVPGFGLFRDANRFKLLAALYLCVVAAHGGATLVVLARRWDRDRVRAGLGLGLGLATILALALALPLADRSPALPSMGSMIALALVTAAVIAAIALVPPRWAGWLLLVLVPIAILDPQRYVHARGAALEPAQDNLEDLAWLDGLADVRRDFAIYDEFVLEQRPGPRLQIREMRGYPAGSSLEYQRYADLVRELGSHPELLAAYNVRYLFWGPHHRVSRDAYYIKRPPDQLAPGAITKLRDKVYELAHPAPLLAWYGAVDAVAGPGPTLMAKVLAGRDPDGVRRRVVVEPDGSRALGAAAASLTAAAAHPPVPVAGQVDRFEASRVSGTIDAPSAGVVVLALTMYPGWEVWVDGERATPFYVDELLRGVAVGPGHHRIEWRFHPAGHGLRLFGFWLGIVALLSAWIPRRDKYLRK